ncbi:hypothetical protein, unlikely [Trypanosoma brucei gambiense DAL972]|uniref:Uncharacterized protein n=1 Tax=Trypanosoma brucei gambiense (strain MHOM/CI/86/DAL972) TaxID=679716 RepID=D0A4S6_TRYB9|nr:hypothetical protein, unlikely [Trypanosoma brucei gambiense DAL972]CBH16270.1 hypothetical protein, unlikely [Trypanosoma brucei gambiense DAL972]|eukprot:XP_011778534.1 hypothetical protein, unlikely [Trypanosoma brucei gambiense DAL972]
MNTAEDKKVHNTQIPNICFLQAQSLCAATHYENIQLKKKKAFPGVHNRSDTQCTDMGYCCTTTKTQVNITHHTRKEYQNSSTYSTRVPQTTMRTTKKLKTKQNRNQSQTCKCFPDARGYMITGPCKHLQKEHAENWLPEHEQK